MSQITTLAFENTTFEIVDQNGQPWLRATDVANALGYSRSDKVGRLYSRNADEFTPAMTAVIETPTSGASGNLVTETRIFSLRGAHLLAMFARTEHAKAFRVWLLDLIEAQAGAARSFNPAIDYERISPAQQQHLQELVHLVAESGVQNYAETWARFHRKFKVPGYKDLPAARFDDAVAYLKGKMSDTDTMAMVQRHMGARVEAIVNSVSVIAGSVVQQAVAQLLHQPSSARMVFGIGYDRAGNPTPIVQPVRDDQCVMSVPEMLKHIRDEPVTLSPADIAKTIGSLQAVLVRMASRPALA